MRIERLVGVLVLWSLAAACSPETGDTVASDIVVPERPQCVAPSKPGGGFDLTCKLAQKALLEFGLLDRPMRVTYQPGGIGAVSYNTIVAQTPDDNNLIVAFSGGSLLNLAQGKFGRYTEDDVRWIAAEGIDYGMLAVRSDSPYKNLNELIDALRQDPTIVVFGAGGTVGSQDWMKSAIIARAAGIDYRAMRYVSFEGGGEAQTALLGAHIQAYSGDISEMQGLLEAGQVRVLAVMSDERLPPPFDEVPTAKEQGFDLVWPILRGFYTGAGVSDAEYDWWVHCFESMMTDKRFGKLRTEFGMFPYAKTGAALQGEIKERMQHYRSLAEDFGMIAANGSGSR